MLYSTRRSFVHLNNQDNTNMQMSFPRRITTLLILSNNAVKLFPCEKSKFCAELNFRVKFFIQT